MSSERKEVFTSSGFTEILEERYCNTFGMFFSFLAPYINSGTGFVEPAPMTRFDFNYSSLGIPLTGYKSSKMTDNVGIGELTQNMKEFKPVLKSTLDKNCEPGLYSLKFHRLDRVVDDLGQFGFLDFEDASPF